jgi:hypothetical protein
MYAVLGAFAKLGKVTLSYAMSLCLPVYVYVRPHGTARLLLEEFLLSLVLECLFKTLSKKYSSFIDM